MYFQIIDIVRYPTPLEVTEHVYSYSFDIFLLFEQSFYKFTIHHSLYKDVITGLFFKGQCIGISQIFGRTIMFSSYEKDIQNKDLSICSCDTSISDDFDETARNKKINYLNKILKADNVVCECSNEKDASVVNHEDQPKRKPSLLVGLFKRIIGSSEKVLESQDTVKHIESVDVSQVNSTDNYKVKTFCDKHDKLKDYINYNKERASTNKQENLLDNLQFTEKVDLDYSNKNEQCKKEIDLNMNIKVQYHGKFNSTETSIVTQDNIHNKEREILQQGNVYDVKNNTHKDKSDNKDEIGQTKQDENIKNVQRFVLDQDSKKLNKENNILNKQDDTERPVVSFFGEIKEEVFSPCEQKECNNCLHGGREVSGYINPLCFKKFILELIDMPAKALRKEIDPFVRFNLIFHKFKFYESYLPFLSDTPIFKIPFPFHSFFHSNFLTVKIILKSRIFCFGKIKKRFYFFVFAEGKEKYKIFFWRKNALKYYNLKPGDDLCINGFRECNNIVDNLHINSYAESFLLNGKTIQVNDNCQIWKFGKEKNNNKSKSFGRKRKTNKKNNIIEDQIVIHTQEKEKRKNRVKTKDKDSKEKSNANKQCISYIDKNAGEIATKDNDRIEYQYKKLAKRDKEVGSDKEQREYLFQEHKSKNQCKNIFERGRAAVNDKEKSGFSFEGNESKKPCKNIFERSGKVVDDERQHENLFEENEFYNQCENSVGRFAIDQKQNENLTQEHEFCDQCKNSVKIGRTAVNNKDHHGYLFEEHKFQGQFSKSVEDAGTGVNNKDQHGYLFEEHKFQGQFSKSVEDAETGAQDIVQHRYLFAGNQSDNQCKNSLERAVIAIIDQEQHVNLFREHKIDEHCKYSIRKSVKYKSKYSIQEQNNKFKRKQMLVCNKKSTLIHFIHDRVKEGLYNNKQDAYSIFNLLQKRNVPINFCGYNYKMLESNHLKVNSRLISHIDDEVWVWQNQNIKNSNIYNKKYTLNNTVHSTDDYKMFGKQEIRETRGFHIKKYDIRTENNNTGDFLNLNNKSNIEILISKEVTGIKDENINNNKRTHDDSAKLENENTGVPDLKNSKTYSEDNDTDSTTEGTDTSSQNSNKGKYENNKQEESTKKPLFASVKGYITMISVLLRKRYKTENYLNVQDKVIEYYNIIVEDNKKYFIQLFHNCTETFEALMTGQKVEIKHLWRLERGEFNFLTSSCFTEIKILKKNVRQNLKTSLINNAISFLPDKIKTIEEMKSHETVEIFIKDTKKEVSITNYCFPNEIEMSEVKFLKENLLINETRKFMFKAEFIAFDLSCFQKNLKNSYYKEIDSSIVYDLILNDEEVSEHIGSITIKNGTEEIELSILLNRFGDKNITDVLKKFNHIESWNSLYKMLNQNYIFVIDAFRLSYDEVLLSLSIMLK